MLQVRLLLLALLTFFAASPPPSRGQSPMDVAPSSGLVLATTESWGRVCGQRVLGDPGSRVSDPGETIATIFELERIEDRVERQELYLAFPLKEVNGLDGFLVGRFRCDGEGARLSEAGSLAVKDARLVRQADGWALTAQVRGRGRAKLDLLYSRRPGMKSSWVLCRDGGRPTQADLYDADPLPSPKDTQARLTPDWSPLALPLGVPTLARVESVDRSLVVFEALTARFASDADSTVLGPRIREESAVRAVATEAAGRDGNVNVALTRGRESVVQIGRPNVVPDLSRPCAVTGPDGRLQGLCISIRTDH